MTSLAAGVQRAPQRIPPIGIESMTGRDSFSFYCSPCHGSDGKGNGPVAAALQTAPPDLTLLSRHAGGTFPRSQVQEFVTGTGRPVPAHGSGEMPIWGPIFRSLDPSDARVKVRIVNLVEFLETIQAR
jgi:hypothetical protein